MITKKSKYLIRVAREYKNEYYKCDYINFEQIFYSSMKKDKTIWLNHDKMYKKLREIWSVKEVPFMTITPVNLTLEDWVKYLSSIDFEAKKGSVKWEATLIDYISRLNEITKEEAYKLAICMCKYYDIDIDYDSTCYSIIWKRKRKGSKL